MAKKIVKLLAVSAILTGIVCLGITLYKKFISKDSWDDDFDDFDDDFDDEEIDIDEIKSREYVPITLETPQKTKKVEETTEVEKEEDTKEAKTEEVEAEK